MKTQYLFKVRRMKPARFIRANFPIFITEFHLNIRTCHQTDFIILESAISIYAFPSSDETRVEKNVVIGSSVK